jgi:hypothetical protein
MRPRGKHHVVELGAVLPSPKRKGVAVVQHLRQVKHLRHKLLEIRRGVQAPTPCVLEAIEQAVGVVEVAGLQLDMQ